MEVSYLLTFLSAVMRLCRVPQCSIPITFANQLIIKLANYLTPLLFRVFAKGNKRGSGHSEWKYEIGCLQTSNSPLVHCCSECSRKAISVAAVTRNGSMK